MLSLAIFGEPVCKRLLARFLVCLVAPSGSFEATMSDPLMFGATSEWDADRSRFHAFMRDRVF